MRRWVPIDTPRGSFVFGGALSGNGQLAAVNTAGLNGAWLLDTGNSPTFTGNIVIGDGIHTQSGIQYRSNAANPLGTGTITVNALGLLTADNGGSSSPGTVPNSIILNGGTFRHTAITPASYGAHDQRHAVQFLLSAAHRARAHPTTQAVLLPFWA